MKKILCVTLIVVLCLPLLFSCSTLHGDNDKGATVSMYLAAFPQSLDPSAVQMDAATSALLALIYQPLTTLDSKGKTKPALASSWYGKYNSRDEEYEMYFVLNESCWSDGISVSADDVVYAWKRILAPGTESPYASILFPIKNAKDVKAGVKTSDDLGLYAEDDLLLRIVFEVDYDINLFAEAVSCIALSPLREDIITKAIKDNNPASSSYDRLNDWDKNAAIMVCNGPFKVQGYEQGAKLSFERNPYYYRDAEEDALDKSVVPYRLVCYYQEATLSKAVENPIIEQQYEYNRYTEGKVFYLGNFTKELYNQLKGDLETTKLLSTYSYCFNTKNELFQDARVRKALSMALDRNAIADLLGTGEIAATGFVPSGVFETNAGTDFRSAGGSLYATSAQLEEAKTLLSQAGVNGGSFKISYLLPLTNKDSFYTTNNGKRVIYDFAAAKVAEYAKSVWEGLGFKVTVEAVYANNYPTALSSGDFDVIGMDFVGNSTDALTYLAPFARYYSGNAVSVSLEAASYTPHYTGYESDAYDALADSVIYVSDRSARASILHEMEKMLCDDCPAIALYQYQTSYLASGELSKITTDYFGFNNYNNLRLSDYLDVNSRENEESIAHEASLQTASNS